MQIKKLLGWFGGRGKLATAGIVAAGLAVGGIGFGASADAASSSLPRDSVTSVQIAPGGITQQGDLSTGLYNLLRTPKAGSVWSSSLNANIVTEEKLAPEVRGKLNDTKGQVTALEADGPYPGSTKLQDYPGNGANSTAKVPADGKSHAVWVMCAEGKTALGGGFRVGADQGDAVAAKIQVTASEPTQVVKDGDDYKLQYTPIEGDAAGSLEPNGWLVEVINAGDVDATVRPWVTCAKVAKVAK